MEQIKIKYLILKRPAGRSIWDGFYSFATESLWESRNLNCYNEKYWG